MNILKEKLDLIDAQQSTKIQVHSTQSNDFSNADETCQGVVLIKASDIKHRPIDWIWKGWLAAGKFHLIGGIAGTGKTTLSLSIASCISSGKLFPDGQKCEVGEVVMWSGEDDLEDTLKPRLMAMGANLDKVQFVKAYNDGQKNKAFNPATDLQELQLKLKEIKNIKLLIIDPIVSVITKDSHNNAETRQDLQPIVHMAQELGFAVIGITHFTKNTSGKEPVERITGSLAFGALARMVIVASKGKDQNGNENRIFIRAKSNITKDTGGFEYSLEEVDVGEGICISKVVWGKKIEGSAFQLLADTETNLEDGARQGCKEYLIELLGEGFVKESEIRKDCIASGYSVSTYKRARRELNIKTEKIGFGKDSYHVLELPMGLTNIQRGSHINMSLNEKIEPLCDNSASINAMY